MSDRYFYQKSNNADNLIRSETADIKGLLAQETGVRTAVNRTLNLDISDIKNKIPPDHTRNISGLNKDMIGAKARFEVLDNAVSGVKPSLKKIESKVTSLDSEVKVKANDINQIAKKSSKENSIVRRKTDEVAIKSDLLKRDISIERRFRQRIGDAQSGNIYLEPLVVDVSKAVLDAAIADSDESKKNFDVNLASLDVNGLYATHIWANLNARSQSKLDLPLVPVSSFDDVDIGDATVEAQISDTADPEFISGVCSLKVLMDCDASVSKVFKAWVKATDGVVTNVAKANLVDGETVTIEDALGTSVVFEYDVTGDGVTAGNMRVDVSEITTDIEVAVKLAAAVNLSALVMTAIGNGADTELNQGEYGAAGNTTITETVNDGGFSVTSFTNGVDNDKVTIPMVMTHAKGPTGATTDIIDNQCAGSYVAPMSVIVRVVD